MPEAIPIPHRDMAHLDREEHFERRLPGLFVDVAIDAEGPGHLTAVLQQIHSGSGYFGEIESGIPVVEELAPGFRRPDLGELPLTADGQSVEACLFRLGIARIEF